MLHIIPTPIGNKEDITLRALRLLRELDIIFCEDPSSTKKLLKLYDIDYKITNKQLYIFNSFLSDKQWERYIDLVRNKNVWLVSDAWTPWLSDPAKELIRQCRIHTLPFEVLPWANALIPMVVASNRDSTHFTFVWFLPKKKGRQTMLKLLIQSIYPVYFYESVHRIEKTLEELDTLWFVGHIMIARELTKLHEQYAYGSIQEILSDIVAHRIPLKGEFVVGIAPSNAKSS